MISRAPVARIHCLVDTGDDHTLLADLVAAGVDGFQIRAKDATSRDLLALTHRALATGATVVVNDRLDIALAAGAHGVHLGASDLSVTDARRIAPDLVIGATCRTPRKVRQAQGAGADYVGFGPLFATSSKAGLPDPLGVDAIAAVVGSLPVVGIGGIDAARAVSVIRAGAHGVAVIGGIWRQSDPLAAAKELVQAVG